MGALRTAIPQHLRTFVEPQIEQLSLRMESVRCGLCATLPKSLGEGFLWTAALGEGCLVSMHLIRLKKPIILEKRPTDFFCVFSGSSATLRSLPNAHTEATAERENVLSFSQTGGTTRCLMRAGDLYESTSITYTPGYFESIRKRIPDDFGSGETDVARVARAVGYARTSAFDEAFRRTFGCSPTQWRRRPGRSQIEPFRPAGRAAF